MSPPGEENSPLFECIECCEKFKKKYNLERHMVRKHMVDANIETQQNNRSTQQNNRNNRNTQQNNHSNTSNDNGNCPKCKKDFSTNWRLIRHISKCTGSKNKLQCEHCLKNFTHERSRFKHYKTCSVKKQQIINNIINNNNITNIGSQQNIETQNNNNIIIVYNPTGNTPFSTEHLKAEDLKKIIKLASSHLDNRAMAEYSKQIFSHPENRCVKKTNLKASHSQIHTGDNKWEFQLDKNIYPQLATDLANNMSEYIDQKREALKKDMYIRLRDFVDCMCDSGYINTDDENRERELKNEYNTFMNGLKLIIYGNTKIE